MNNIVKKFINHRVYTGSIALITLMLVLSYIHSDPGTGFIKTRIKLAIVGQSLIKIDPRKHGITVTIAAAKKHSTSVKIKGRRASIKFRGQK